MDLIGKHELGPARIITIVADHFSLLEDHAVFLKATYAINSDRQLPVDEVPKHIIQFGPIHRHIVEQIGREKNWFVHEYKEDISLEICDKIEKDVEKACNSNASPRSIIYINELSCFKIVSHESGKRVVDKGFLKLLHHWKHSRNFFVVIFYENWDDSSKLLRDLRYLSDAFVMTKLAKELYFQQIWYQPTPTHRTLMPPKVRTSYYTCKIGKSNQSHDLLAFVDHKQVPKNYDPSNVDIPDLEKRESGGIDLEILKPSDEDTPIDRTTTLPYVEAQNPEKSRIFYYPDKEDDFDEDDPDCDLAI